MYLIYFVRLVEIKRNDRQLECTMWKSSKKAKLSFHVLLSVHNGMILVNNQIDAQFFMYVYFYFLHVSGGHVPIIRRIIVSMRHLVYVTV